MKKSISYINIIIVLLFIVSISVSCVYAKEADVGFGIYLLETGELILSDKHIVSYNKNTHEIELTEEGVENWTSYIPYEKSSSGRMIPRCGGLDPKEFVLKLNGEETYRGKFDTVCGSTARFGMLLGDTRFLSGDKKNIIIIDFLPRDKTEKDPRDNKDLMDYFEQMGLLK